MKFFLYIDKIPKFIESILIAACHLPILKNAFHFFLHFFISNILHSKFERMKMRFLSQIYGTDNLDIAFRILNYIIK